MTVVLLSSDLTVLPRVESTASRYGNAVRIASTSSQAIDFCNSEKAGLLIVDLATPSLDIGAVVNLSKSNAASAPRIVAFGPHVHEDKLAAAQVAGCDLVVSRGQFFSQLEAILRPA
jgi:DNA-binding response OmpR family regulator